MPKDFPRRRCKRIRFIWRIKLVVTFNRNTDTNTCNNSNNNNNNNNNTNNTLLMIVLYLQIIK